MADMRSPLDQPHVHHEESDVNVSAITKFIAGLAGAAIVIHLLVFGLFWYLDVREARRPRAGPAAAASGPVVPPEPRLQERPRVDLRELRAREDAVLSSYGWIDRDAGKVRIPIDVAMRLTLERGLPARGPQPAPAGPGEAP